MVVFNIDCFDNRHGRVSHEQRQFLDSVTAAGGVAGVARSVDDALALLP